MFLMATLQPLSPATAVFAGIGILITVRLLPPAYLTDI